MKRRQGFVLACVIAVLSMVSGCDTPPSAAQQTTPASSASQASSGTTAPTDTQHCRPDVLAGVYHPYRLDVKDPCKTASGTVDRVRHETDGDFHINVKLDSQYSDLINDKNSTAQHGDLVVEIIPMDEPNVPTPTVGEHLTVTGAYVLDKDHGWMEIHPAWFINGKGLATYDKSAADKSAQSPTDEENNSDVQSAPTPSPAVAATSAPAPQQQATVQILNVTSPVARNSYATLRAKVTPGCTASIEVEYKSGPSHAQGLEDKTAGSDGLISWTWKVAGNTAIGSWPVTVSCNGSSVTTQFEVVH